MDLSTFGSPAWPLRCSILPLLMRCNLSGIVQLLGENTSGQAADTGSAVHMAARAFHTVAKGDALAAIGVMHAAKELHFPLADLAAAEQQFRRYSKDERNAAADIVLCEEKVEFTLDPAEDDPTQEGIVIRGTLDQVRRHADGKLGVWDIKTGASYEGADMIPYHCFQLVAYQWGASLKLGEPVRKCGVIRTKDYLKPRVQGKVFHEADWYYRDCEPLLQLLASQVARIRRRAVGLSPSPGDCRWCPLGGVANCLGRHKEITA